MIYIHYTSKQHEDDTSVLYNTSKFTRFMIYIFILTKANTQKVTLALQIFDEFLL